MRDPAALDHRGDDNACFIVKGRHRAGARLFLFLRMSRCRDEHQAADAVSGTGTAAAPSVVSSAMRNWISPLVVLFLMGICAYVFASLYQAGALTERLVFLE